MQLMWLVWWFVMAAAIGMWQGARATLASWAKVVKWLQSLQLHFKAYQHLNLNKKEKRPLCIGREGRAWFRSSTSVCTHTHTQSHGSGKHTDIKTQTLKATQTITSRHSKSHKSADTQIYKKQTSSYAHIKTSTDTHTHGMSPVFLAGQLWEVTQTWQFCYQASIKAYRFKHSLLKSHQSQTLGSLISHLPFNTSADISFYPPFHDPSFEFCLLKD